MNRQELIQKGQELQNIEKLSELKESYTDWREEVLKYAKQNEMDERLRILLHNMDTPYGVEEEKREQYITCIKNATTYLKKYEEEQSTEEDALEKIIKNFGLYLKNMFQTEPEKKSTLKKEVLAQIQIENEYDVQHIMYAVVKALYPSARREVNQDTGYGTVRYDILIKEIDTVIEIKCSRPDHTDRKLLRELGEDGYFYDCSRLLMYVYDKEQKIQDVDSFVHALERDRAKAGKVVKVYVEQKKEIL